MFDIFSIGDTTTDIFLDINQASVHCDINKQDCRLCINYADKIPVRTVTRLYGVGNAANNAIGSARLGLKTGIYTIIGNDLEGKNALNEFIQNEVITDYVVQDTEHGTNYSTVLNFDGERTILVFHEERKYALPMDIMTKWIYFTSVAHGSENLHAEVVAYVKQHDTKLAFNPGTFQMQRGLAALKSTLAVTQLLFVNKHEAQRLLTSSEEDVFSLGLGLLQEGPAEVIITDGENGSYYISEDTKLSIGILDVPAVERTGCGDAFATASVGARIAGETPAEMLRWGSANAASVLQKIGAQAGLMSEKEIRDMLAHTPSFQPKVY